MDTKLLHISEVPILTGSSYAPGSSIKLDKFAGRRESRLAKAVGLTQFGVNRVTLEPGSMSALRHWHEAEDEFIYVLTGELVLIDDNGEHMLVEGCFAGFPAGQPNAHHIVNKSGSQASYVVVGSRKHGQETIHYPDDDLGPIRK